MSEPKKTYYTVSEIAKLKDVTTQTVRDWISAGYIPAQKVNPNKPGSPFRIRKTAEMERFITGQSERQDALIEMMLEEGETP